MDDETPQDRPSLEEQAKAWIQGGAKVREPLWCEKCGGELLQVARLVEPVQLAGRPSPLLVRAELAECFGCHKQYVMVSQQADLSGMDSAGPAPAFDYSYAHSLILEQLQPEEPQPPAIDEAQALEARGTVIHPMWDKDILPTTLEYSMSVLAVDMIEWSAKLKTLSSRPDAHPVIKDMLERWAGDVEKYGTAVWSLGVQLQRPLFENTNLSDLISLASKHGLTLPKWVTGEE